MLIILVYFINKPARVLVPNILYTCTLNLYNFLTEKLVQYFGIAVIAAEFFKI